MADTHPETLYHYCSLNTFLNIMKNKSIWVSDIERSNDFLELITLRKLLANHINADLNEIIDRNMMSNGDKERAKSLWKLRDDFMNRLATAYARTFVFCLSLSQWRGYADDGNGVAIGFKTSFFEELGSKNLETKVPVGFTFDKVTYDENVAKDYLRRQLDRYNWYGCKEINEYEESLKKLTARISADAPFYKKLAFAEEKEWRLVVLHFVNNLGNLKLSELNDSSCSFGEIEYTVSNNRLVPHIDIKIKDMKSAISKIIIGPKCKEKETDIRQFLVCMGILDSAGDMSINISKSEASYR